MLCCHPSTKRSARRIIILSHTRGPTPVTGVARARAGDLRPVRERLWRTEEPDIPTQVVVYCPDVRHFETDVGRADVVVRDALVGVAARRGSVLQQLDRRAARVKEHNVHVNALEADERAELLVRKREAIAHRQSKRVPVLGPRSRTGLRRFSSRP